MRLANEIPSRWIVKISDISDRKEEMFRRL